jgi:hypothetical protein
LWRFELKQKVQEAMQYKSFVCSSCGLEHAGVPLSFAADYPDPYANLSLDDRDARAIAGSDQCIIDQREFYIRGCLELPILGADDVFLWGLWARVKEEVFDEIDDHWESQGKENSIGPYKGRLANALSIYPNTMNQRLEIQIRPVGSRPLFILEELDNPLSVEQRNGITRKQAEEYACLLLRMAKG